MIWPYAIKYTLFWRISLVIFNQVPHLETHAHKAPALWDVISYKYMDHHLSISFSKLAVNCLCISMCASIIVAAVISLREIAWKEERVGWQVHCNILKRKIRLMRKRAKEERMSFVSEVIVQSRLSIIDLFPLHGVIGQAPAGICGYLTFHMSSRWFTHTLWWSLF